MLPPTMRKTYKYKLQPTPEQERAMAFVVRRCRELYNAALHERRDAWQKRGVSVTLACQAPSCQASRRFAPNSTTTFPGVAGCVDAA